MNNGRFVGNRQLRIPKINAGPALLQNDSILAAFSFESEPLEYALCTHCAPSG
jgi:hypothetical protein